MLKYTPYTGTQNAGILFEKAVKQRNIENNAGHAVKQTQQSQNSLLVHISSQEKRGPLRSLLVVHGYEFL